MNIYLEHNGCFKHGCRSRDVNNSYSPSSKVQSGHHLLERFFIMIKDLCGHVSNGDMQVKLGDGYLKYNKNTHRNSNGTIFFQFGLTL